jgi:hypothetical protein
MADIQDLRKPSYIPPVSLEKLNDYIEEKTSHIRMDRDNVKDYNGFDPKLICYLQTIPNYHRRPPEYDEYIGYIISHSGTWFFLPFYKRSQFLNGAGGNWETYIRNFKLDDRREYMFIYYLGINEPAERERAAGRVETTVRAGVKEDDERGGIEMKTKNPETGKYDIGGRRTRRRKFRNKKSRKSKKSRKTRKYKRK